MAKWSATQNNWTPTAVADATNFTNSGYFAWQGGSPTQRANFLELYMGGLAGASAPAQMIVARDSTVGATGLSGGTLAALDPATAALAAPPLQFSTSTTKPQRSATLYLLLPVFNAFGGVVRLNQPPGQEIGLLGNTASFGEISLSHASTGTPGLMGCHFIVDVF
jgi:hypothetical protein